MAVNVTGKIIQGHHCEATHGPSGSVIRTTSPVDNGGDGSLFSPTDLCATSIGLCMLTIMAQWGEKHGLDLSGSSFALEKHMASDTPRRIDRVPITFSVKGDVPEDKRPRLEAAAMKCPVKQSLHETVQVECEFVYG